MNDMFLVLEMCEDYNYTDNNTISDVQYTPDELKCLLEHDANTNKNQGIVFGVKPGCPMSFTVKGITVECKDEVN